MEGFVSRQVLGRGSGHLNPSTHRSRSQHASVPRLTTFPIEILGQILAHMSGQYIVRTEVVRVPLPSHVIRR